MIADNRGMPNPQSPVEPNHTALQRVPTIARVAGDTLVELVYDPEKRATALAVSRFGGLWNIEQEVRIGDELLVPYSARNNLIARGCVQLPSKPEEYGRKDDLIADIAAFLHAHVDLSPLFEKIAAHYVLLTWVHDRFSDVGYLRLRGEFGSGKTRGLMAIGSLCYRSFFASAASTVSPIFHTIDAFGGTLVLDEADLPYSDARAELVKILNNGSTKDMPVLRTMQNRYREFNPQAFQVFGPKIVAMRGSFDDPALESRFATEEMGMRPVRPDIPVHLPHDFKDKARSLRNRLLHYRLCRYFDTEPDAAALGDGGASRINQTALAVLSLVDDPALRAEIQGYYAAQDALLRSDRREALDAQVLKAAYDAFQAADGAGDVSLRAIGDSFNAAHCSDVGRPATGKWIGFILRKQLHLITERRGGVYVVPRAEFSKIETLATRLGILD